MTWLPASITLLNQYSDFYEFFKEKVRDIKARTLENLYGNNCNRLYLVFLKSILLEVQSVNLAFEQTEADITKLYTDLKNLLFSLCMRVLRPEALVTVKKRDTLSSNELLALKEAFSFHINLKPLNDVDFGKSFDDLIKNCNIAVDKLQTVKMHCADYIIVICKEIIKRLPNNVDVIDKIRHFSPATALSRLNRPVFHALPLDLLGTYN